LAPDGFGPRLSSISGIITRTVIGDARATEAIAEVREVWGRQGRETKLEVSIGFYL
jgi:hypothetical protein